MLSALAPAEAAAYFVMRRAEGLTPTEHQLLAQWLAKDDAHRSAFDSTDRAWRSFDEPGGNEILAAMRAHAVGARPRGWRPLWATAAAAAVVVLAVGAALIFLPSITGYNSQRTGPA